MRNYFVALTWLRALAAFFVVITHSIVVNNGRHKTESLDSLVFSLNLLDLGDFAVYLFFALSGCTLTLSNRTSIIGLQHIFFFYYKRFMRIWPSFAVSLVIYLTFIPVFKKFYNGDPSIYGLVEFVRDYRFGDVVNYLWLSFNFTEAEVHFNTVYWSLPVEFQYYLCLPLTLMAIRGRVSGYIVSVALGILFFILGKHLEKLGIHIPRNEVFTMAFSFFGGVLVAHLSFYHKLQLPHLVGLPAFIALLFLASFIANRYFPAPDVLFFRGKGNIYGSLAIACVFLALFTKPIKSQNKLSSFIYRYGQISYSIYLYHMLFVGISVLLIAQLGIQNQTLQVTLTWITTLIGSYLFSLLTYKYIEEPSMTFGKKLFNKAAKTEKT